jgi:hypothetical protein
MKNINILFGLLVSLISCQFAFCQKIDSMEIIPSSPTTFDSVLFATFSEPFSGDCSYELKLDGTSSNKIYISGKYDSNGKCLTDGANDTINLGKLPVGAYTIYLSFIDTYGLIETDESTLEFNVSQFTGLNKLEQKKKINVYPNPCNLFLTISNLSAISEPRLIQMYKSTGQQVLVKHINSFDSEIIIDMSSYKRGLYYLTTNDKTMNVRVIKE